jgi:hypothetical protein
MSLGQSRLKWVGRISFRVFLKGVSMPKVNLIWLVLALTVSIASVSMAAAQQSAGSQGAWAGWARCEIRVSGQGYSDQQTHTWMIGGGTPTVSGAFRVYPATWSVVGGGSLQRTQGNQTLQAQLATSAQVLSAPIAVFVRASDGRMFVQARHAQVRAARSVNGYQQQTIDGKAQKPATIASEAFEWAFPVVEVSRPKPGENATANGSSTPVVNGKLGYMQPADAQATASCTWQFSQGADAPAPPPAVTAQAIPTPPSEVATTPPGQAGGGAAGCPSAPLGLGGTVSGQNVTLQWSAPASGSPTSYVVQASDAPAGPANLANFDTNSTDPRLSATNVPTGTYYIRVHARNSSCASSTFTSPASNEVLLVIP